MIVLERPRCSDLSRAAHAQRRLRCVVRVLVGLFVALLGLVRTASADDSTADAGAPPVAGDDDSTVRASDSIPGSPRPAGLGLSPQAPPVPPAPGGRAPSFGAPTQDPQWSFRIGGRIAGAEAIGIGRRPEDAPVVYSGTALHVPALTEGRMPFFPGAGATLYFQTGTPIVTAYVLFYARMSGEDYNGYYNPQAGPDFGQAYLLITPAPVGPWHFSWRVGGFIETYGGPGQWGWGIFGPTLAVRGFGETTNADVDVSPDLRFSFTHGVLAVPGVPENFVRGDYNTWIETGVSDYLQHAHAGLIYKNQYSLRLHYVGDHSTDERKYLLTFLNTPPHDGHFDTYQVEARWLADPYGQFGITAMIYDFGTAASVGDGIWWGLDWTQGAREMINKFLGPNSDGTGKVQAISAEYDTSIARILWAPRAFDGRAPDLRLAVAGMQYWTFASDDPDYKNATGYYVGTEAEYRFSSLFSLTFQAYGENRASNIGRWAVYSLNPGVQFHSDWLSTDRILFVYSRRFYSSAVDNNAAAPLDRDVFTLGGYFTF